MNLRIETPRQAGDYLKEIRKKRGMTQAQLAEKSGFTIMTLQNVESGRTSYNMNTFLAIASVLGVDLYLKEKETNESI